MEECCTKFKPLVSVFLRIGLGVVFIYHGYGKVFAEGAGMGTSWNPQMSVVLQVLVSWGELVGGIAILVGFLTSLASLGIIIIMTGAIITVHAKNGFGMGGGGFEYNFVLISMCLALIANGSGPYSIGQKCCKSNVS